MTIAKNHYVIIGMKFAKDEFLDALERTRPEEGKTDIYHHDVEPFMDSPYSGIFHHENVCILYGEDDIYVGHVIQKSGDDGDLDDFVSESIPKSGTVLNWIYDMFGFAGPCKTFCITHYR